MGRLSTDRFSKTTKIAMVFHTLGAIVYILILRDLIVTRGSCYSSASTTRAHSRVFFPTQEQANSLLEQSSQIPHHGFVLLEEIGDSPQLFGVSMFHQLHCLEMIRQSVNGSEQSMDHESYHPIHLDHCLDYIAQAIVCAADDTIERGEEKTIEGKTINFIEGLGVVHKCRDSAYIWETSIATLAEPLKVAELQGGETLGGLLGNR